jgi:hypothetical protein
MTRLRQQIGSKPNEVLRKEPRKGVRTFLGKVYAYQYGLALIEETTPAKAQ